MFQTVKKDVYKSIERRVENESDTVREEESERDVSVFTDVTMMTMESAVCVLFFGKYQKGIVNLICKGKILL